MASCANGALQGIFETVCLAGGLSGCEFITATTTYLQRTLLTALASSAGDIFIYCQKDGKSAIKVVPWSAEDSVKPAALAFSPTAEWLLVAIEDGRICILPVGKYIEGWSDGSDRRFPMNDVVMHQATGSRAKPTAIVWWQTVTGDASVAIVGTELGELCFVELTSGKDVGGTYITVPVKQMFLCQDNSQDTVYLLITGTEDRQWRLVLEQKSHHYMFPLENISPEWDEDESLVGPLSLATTAPSPRLRLMNLKQLSVEKFQLLKQRLSEAKHSSKKKPLTENKGVDTCDIDEEPSANSTIITPQSEPCSSNNSTPTTVPGTNTTTLITTTQTSTNTTTTAGESSPNAPVAGGSGMPPAPPASSDNERPTTAISARPERLYKYIYDVVASPQYNKEKCLLAGHYKPNSCLMVYSTDLESTPLYVYKLPEDTSQIVLHEQIIFALRKTDPPRISVISTFYASSTKIDGEIDNKIDPILQEIYLPDGEEVLHIFPCPPAPTSTAPVRKEGTEYSDKDEEDVENRSDTRNQEMDDTDSEFDYEVDLPSHTKPNACLVVTKTSIYLCQTRKSVENLFMELALGTGEIEAANRLAAIFSLDSKLFELAADFKLRKRCFASAIMLYKQSRCPHVKCSLKFAWAGFVPEFITYMSSLTSGAGGPDLGLEQRKHLATLAVIAHLHQLSLPLGIRTLQQQQTTLRNLLLLLRNNLYYDEILTLVVATATWRWETLQYLASNRGLLLEKLHALLNLKNSPIISSLHPSTKDPLAANHKSVLTNPNGNGCVAPPICREKEKGFLHCISDPELRGVLLLNPLLARSHMAFVLDHLDSLDVAILRRLAALYDPTQPAMKPFLLSAAYFHKPAVASYAQTQSKSNQQCSLLPPASDDPIGLDTLTQIFLAILIKLNQKRGWKYNPDLLTLSPIEPVKKKPFFDSCIARKPLACGYSHSVVIIDGIVYSWGLGDYGALGHPPKSSTNPSLLKAMDPILCTELRDFTSSQNGPELFATKKNEPLVQSPDGSNGECFQPKVVSYLSNMKTYSVSCGKNYTLAITNYGVYGWGNNRYGQLGTGGTGCHPRPTLITSLVDAEVVQVACGQFHSLAVTRDGRLFTWGWGVHGQLGHGNVEDCLKPTLVKKLSKKVVVRAGGGYAHSVALTRKGTVYAWGCSTYGQVGAGGITKVTSPTRVHFSKPVKHIVTAYFHNVAVTNDHKVFVWGSNPACLRVQAQIQKRNRSLQQQQQAQEQENVHHHENPPAPPPPTPDTENVTVEQQQPEILEAKNDLSLKVSSVPLRGESEDLAEKSVLADSEGKESVSHTQEKEAEVASISRAGGKALSNLHVVSANTVPSCDPMELGHLLPKEVEMPLIYGAVKALAVGNQHTLLLTTHGTLYSWGRNMSGQLGTGNRKESLTPIRVLEDVYITEISAGADFSLALDSQGQVWGWGSNYYTQLGQGSNSGEDKFQGNKVFMLRTTKRVLKVPHSIHSNVEVPRPIARLPVTAGPSSVLSSQYLHAHSNDKVDLNDMGILSGVELASLESPSKDISEKDMMEDKDDGLYGTVTLHSSLAFLHHHYSPKSLAPMLLECEGHQALATLYTLEKQHSKAMHHQLCALLSHPWIEKEEGKEAEKPDEPTTECDEGKQKRENGEAASDEPQARVATQNEGKCTKDNAYSSSHVNEAVRILDHFLRLQTEESQSGMRLVLQEGIGLWLTHSLPIPQLEDLLLTHLPRTVYPLALLLFGEENPCQNAEESKESGIEDLAQATARILSQLSTKFCLNLCSSVITHLQAGECNIEQLDALSQLARLNIGGGNAPPGKDSASATGEEEKSPYNALMDSLQKASPDAILLSPEEVSSLKSMSDQGTVDDKGVPAAAASAGAKSKKEATRGKSFDKEKEGKEKEKDKDCVLFTCGHHFTNRDFKTKVLPQLERTVTTVPGLLGKTARVLLDQYHSDQPQMACPHCVLAHLTIKLTKHNQPT